MYKIDKNIIFPNFLYSSIIMVKIGLFEFILELDNDVSITLEQKIEIHSFGKSYQWLPNMTEFNINLNTIFQKKIINFEIIEELNLKFILEDNTYFIIYGNNEQFECYQIRSQFNHIIV